MSELSQEMLEATAAAYDSLLVPSVFEPLAHRVADAAQLQPGQRVLDVACGSGVLARAAAERVGPDGAVTGLDINPGMLAVAARRAPGIAWHQGSADNLPFDDGEFDIVVSQFGLMMFADRQAALREMLRVIAPQGRLAVAVFDTLNNAPAYEAVVGVFDRIIGTAVGDALRFPFSLGDTDQLSSLFVESGIALPTVSSLSATMRFASVRDMVLADVDGWFPLAQITLDDATVNAVVAEAETALSPFLAQDGAVEAPISAHIVVAGKD